MNLAKDAKEEKQKDKANTKHNRSRTIATKRNAAKYNAEQRNAAHCIVRKASF